jgi:hypothetical protein
LRSTENWPVNIDEEPVSDMNLEMVNRAASEAARDYNFPVTVVGTVPTSAGANYIEIILRIEGCHKEACHVQLGVFRDVQFDDLRTQVADQIRRHLSER